MSQHPVSAYPRRSFFRLAGASMLAAAGAPMLAACGNKEAASTPWSGSLKMLGWDFQPDTIKRLITEWSGKGNPKVDVSILPNTGYSAALQTRVRGGEVFDVFYNFAYNTQKFLKQGWAAKLNDLPGAGDLVNDLFPSARPAYVDADGAQISVPYFSAVHMLQYNEAMVKKAGFTAPPSGLKETYEQSKKIKESAGVASPYVAYWVKEFCEEYLLTYLLSEGIEPFDAAGAPVFKDNPKSVEVFNWWQTMYTEGLAPKSLLNDDPGKLSSLMADGKAAFFVLHHYFLTSIRNLKGPEAENVKQAPITTTGKTLQMGEVLQMGAISNAQQKEAAWKLMKYYGWKGEDGKFTVFAEWAKAAGLAAPYSGFFTDPAVVEAFPKYVDLSLLSKTFDTGSQVVQARTLPWYPDFQAKVGDLIHALLLGQATPEKTVAALADAAVAAKNSGGL